MREGIPGAQALFHTQVFDWRPAGGSIAEQAPLLGTCKRGDRHHSPPRGLQMDLLLSDRKTRDLPLASARFKDGNAFRIVLVSAIAPC